MGPGEQLKIAYGKINAEAFEKDIELAGESSYLFYDLYQMVNYFLSLYSIVWFAGGNICFNTRGVLL